MPGLIREKRIMKKPLFICSKDYKVSFDEHVFPGEKYGLVRKQLIEQGLVAGKEFLEPRKASVEDLLLVHTREYLNDLLTLTESFRTIPSEIPLNQEIVDFVVLTTGGTILACEKALAGKRAAINLAGGYHHAFPGSAEGFCYVNDIAVAVRRTRERNKGIRVLIVDCDLHQGNGTALIFRNDDEVFTFSIHQEDVYPVPKEKSDLDIGLPGGASGALYLGKVREHLPNVLDSFSPDLIFYDAGADPFIEDQLGNLALTKGDLISRDLYVFGLARERGTPVATVLGGGYAQSTSDVVEIHVDTCRAALQVFQ
jgi:acetoin utilization deacetylase AcuC-like enzyme